MLCLIVVLLGGRGLMPWSMYRDKKTICILTFRHVGPGDWTQVASLLTQRPNASSNSSYQPPLKYSAKWAKGISKVFGAVLVWLFGFCGVWHQILGLVHTREVLYRWTPSHPPLPPLPPPPYPETFNQVSPHQTNLCSIDWNKGK